MTCPIHPDARSGPCPYCLAAQAVQRDEDTTIARRQLGHGHAGKSRAQGRINGVRYGKRLGGVLRRSA